MLAAVRLCRPERGTRKGVSFLTNVISFKNSSFANFFYLPGLSSVTGFHPCKFKFASKNLCLADRDLNAIQAFNHSTAAATLNLLQRNSHVLQRRLRRELHPIPSNALT